MHIHESLGNQLKKTLSAAAVLLLAASLSACGGGDEGESADATSAPKENKEHTVVYEVTGDGEMAASITFKAESGAGASERLDNQALPFTKEFKDTNDSEFDTVYQLSPRQAEGGKSISCKITIDGDVLAEETSTDPMSPPVCTATPDFAAAK